MAFLDEIFDYRYNPFTGVFTPNPIGYSGNPVEEKTIAIAAPYYIFLNELPRQDLVSSLLVNEKGGASFTEVSKTTPPAVGQFHVIYGGDGSAVIGQVGQGIIEFNVADAGKIMEIKYYGLGSILQKAFFEKFTNILDTGWINTDDWIDRHIGSIEIDYDNLSGTFRVGETITESGGNAATGIVISDDGSKLILKEVTNSGIFANNNVITGSLSGATALVNEPSGDNKNKDTNVLHNLDSNLSHLLITVLLSSDGTDDNAVIQQSMRSTGGNPEGNSVFQIDVNNIKIQTGSQGVFYISDAGSHTNWTTNDTFYKIIVSRLN